MQQSLDEQLEADLLSLAKRHRLRTCCLVEGCSRLAVTVNGRPLTSFSSNDYLGLSSHPSLQDAAASASRRSGFGASASRLVSGTLPEHLELETKLSAFLGTQATLLFSTGYQANMGTICALAGPSDLIVSDRSAHASIIDGSRLCRAKLAFYPHLNFLQAEKQLATLGPRARRRFLITESLFSMDGDVAPLPELARLAKTYNAVLIVDEAHALGVLGPAGTGLCSHFRIKPDVLIGTLGKAFGASGAFVSGSAVLREYLINHARTLLFTTALPPPVAAAALASLSLIRSQSGDRLRRSLHAAISDFRAALCLPASAIPSPIIPFLLGDDHSALTTAAFLRDRGFLVQPIRPPSVKEGTSRLRITLSSGHSKEAVSSLASALTSFSTSSPLPPSSRHPPSPPPTFCSQRRSGLFILGTDTGVGKSAVAAAILHLLAEHGHRPVPFKPVETGCLTGPSDALALLRASQRTDLPLSIVCPFPFPDPVAPAVAASISGHPLTLHTLLRAADAASSLGDFLVVESAGGVLTPYGPNLTSADLAEALALPVLLVGRNALGTINHCALAIAELRRRPVQISGLLLVNTTHTTEDHLSNASEILKLTGLLPSAILPFLPFPTPSLLADQLCSLMNIEDILPDLHRRTPNYTAPMS